MSSILSVLAEWLPVLAWAMPVPGRPPSQLPNPYRPPRLRVPRRFRMPFRYSPLDEFERFQELFEPPVQRTVENLHDWTVWCDPGGTVRKRSNVAGLPPGFPACPGVGTWAVNWCTVTCQFISNVAVTANTSTRIEWKEQICFGSLSLDRPARVLVRCPPGVAKDPTIEDITALQPRYEPGFPVPPFFVPPYLPGPVTQPDPTTDPRGRPRPRFRPPPGPLINPPGITPDPEVEPRQDPGTSPGNDPRTQPGPTPAPAPGIDPAPFEFQGPGNRPGPVPEVGPETGPGPGPAPQPDSRIVFRPPGEHELAPPPPGTRERKVYNPLGGFFRAIHEAGELLEVVDCIHKSMPKKYQAANKRYKDKKTGFYRTGSTTNQKLAAIYENFGKPDGLNTGELMNCLILNEIEDQIIGRLRGGASAHGVSTQGRPWQLGFSP